ncbi:MAG: DNA (cytosine-5-)-methyltransferase [Candidatus Omnitrophica bacterium]|nr:DNA (cytosine-5-)-methyltransferase [Candidatus Omnitrophota bacterium]
MEKLKAISLFCGCGGADLGLTGGFTYLGKWYPSTGINVIHSSDIDAKAVKTYNSNFKHEAHTADVHDLVFKRYSADIVMGGFPCQSFSTVNPTKRPEDKKNQLFWQLARVVEQVYPKVFIGENVKGFYTLKNGFYFHLAKEEFERIGYRVYHRLVNASDFGVPQKRERLIIIGVRKSVKNNFSFPDPSHGNGKYSKAVLKQVIDSLEPENPKYYFSKRAVEGVKKAKPNMKRALAQNLDDQCLTITSHLAKVSLNSRDPVLLVDREKELYRRFTPREAARIQSFPDNFMFDGSEGDAYRQIGNAVPPVMMWHQARALVRQIFK